MVYTDDDKAKCLAWKETNEEKYLAFAQANEDNPYLLDGILFKANNMGSGLIGKLFKMLFLTNPKDATSIIDSILGKVDVDVSIDAVADNTEKLEKKGSLWTRLKSIFKQRTPQPTLSDDEIKERRKEASLMLGAYLISSNYYERKVSLFFDVANVNDSNSQQKIDAARPLLMTMARNIIQSSIEINVRTIAEWKKYVTSLQYSESTKHQAQFISDIILEIEDSLAKAAKLLEGNLSHQGSENGDFSSDTEEVQVPKNIKIFLPKEFYRNARYFKLDAFLKEWLRKNPDGKSQFLLFTSLLELQFIDDITLKDFCNYLSGYGVEKLSKYEAVVKHSKSLNSTWPGHEGKKNIDQPSIQIEISKIKSQLKSYMDNSI